MPVAAAVSREDRARVVAAAAAKRAKLGALMPTGGHRLGGGGAVLSKQVCAGVIPDFGDSTA
jgi:hypothetical protein